MMMGPVPHAFILLTSVRNYSTPYRNKGKASKIDLICAGYDPTTAVAPSPLVRIASSLAAAR